MMEHLKKSNGMAELVRKIEYLLDCGLEDVAKSIGYTRQHLTREMKNGNEKIEKLLRERHAEILHSENVAKGSAVPQMMEVLDRFSKAIQEGVCRAYERTKDVFALMRQLRHSELNTTQIYLKSLGLIDNAAIRDAEW